MRLASRAFIALLLVAIAVDFAVLTEGAFRFNTDESIVGVRSGARVDIPRASALDVAMPVRRADAAAIVPRRPRRSVVPDVRADAPAARSHLIVPADSARSSEDH